MWFPVDFPVTNAGLRPGCPGHVISSWQLESTAVPLDRYGCDLAQAEKLSSFKVSRLSLFYVPAEFTEFTLLILSPHVIQRKLRLSLQIH